MVRPKTQGAARKIVWRMNAAAPQGEYLEAEAARDDAVHPVDLHEHGWLASSLELLGGVRVSETPMDTLPGDLIDEFLRR